MRILIAFIGLTALSASASEFSGTWKGTGDMETSTWGKLQIKEVSVEITKSPTNLYFKDCWKFIKDQGDWTVCSPTDLEIRKGTELWNKEFRVGEIREDLIRIEYSNSDFSIGAKAEIDAAGRLNYVYTSLDSHGGYIRQSAILTK